MGNVQFEQCPVCRPVNKLINMINNRAMSGLSSPKIISLLKSDQ